MTSHLLRGLLAVTVAGACGGPSDSPPVDAPAIDGNASDASCTSLLCTTARYSLLVANQDGSNVRVLRTSSFRDMTHPRVSSDKAWVAYTTYNDVNADGCATVDQAYLNTEIRAVRLTGEGDKSIVENVPGELRSNNYWIGSTNELTFLSGPPTDLRIQRATVDANMNVVVGPTEIPVVDSIIPLDPATHSGSNKIVYPGLYNPGSGFVKGIFMMDLSGGGNLVGLSLGRDRTGAALVCADAACGNIMENDPKVSPDGTRVAFMRRAPSSGANGFGWHIFVVPVASPLAEVDISYGALGADLRRNDALPEWIDNNRLLFSTIEVTSATQYAKHVYTMNADGSARTRVPLPEEFRYADVFPFIDAGGTPRMILSAEKIDAACSQ